MQIQETRRLGFHSFREFNEDLLAKQCWRLITNENSLASKFLKGLYIFQMTPFGKQRRAIVQVIYGEASMGLDRF